MKVWEKVQIDIYNLIYIYIILEIFQPGLEYISLEKIEKLEDSWNERRKKVNERMLTRESYIYIY